MTIIRADRFELSDDCYIEMRDGKLAIVENGVNIIEHTPVEHPQGNGPMATGHRLAWLDQNNAFQCDVMTITSDDPTVGAGGVRLLFADGTPLPRDWAGVHTTGADQRWLQINFAGDGPLTFPGTSTHAIYVRSEAGDTAERFAFRCHQTILGDPILQAAGIGSQYPWTPAGTDFAVTAQGFSPRVRIQTRSQNSGIDNFTGIPRCDVIDPGSTLDAGPVLALKRVVPGRASRHEDSLGQILFGTHEAAYYGISVHYREGNNGGARYHVRYNGAFQHIRVEANGTAYYTAGGDFGQGQQESPLLGMGTISTPFGKFAP